MKKFIFLISAVLFLMGGNTYAQNIAVIKNNGDITTYDMNVVDRVAMFMNDEYTDIKQNVGDYIVNDLNSTDPKSISLNRPTKCCKVNITADRLPVTKTENIPGVIEFWDVDGNYFSLNCVLNAQGSSSMEFAIKNLSIDLEKEVKFGNWVAQDGFHLKAYYQDNFRGITNICYNWAEEVIRYTNTRVDRNVADADPEALCHPDGFPCELYFNGEYYSLYTWNLKKHRKNYSMNKKDYESVILDGRVDETTFFGGKINWKQFELKNPKTLVCKDGTEYNGDAPKELIDATSSIYDASNKDHKNTALTKQLLINLSNAIPQIAAETNVDKARQLFEQYFDKDAMMAYYLISQVILHHDGFAKNWIWTIYNGGVAAPTLYDTDATFGRTNNATMAFKDFDYIVLSTKTSLPSGQLYRLYKADLKSMYQSLRDAGIIDVNYIMSFFDEWTNMVGDEAYARDRNAHSDIPSYRKSGLDRRFWINTNIRSGSAPEWNKSTNYTTGDMVKYQGFQFICIADNKNKVPLTISYPNVPYYGGMYDSKDRIREWLDYRIKFLDGKFGK